MIDLMTVQEVADKFHCSVQWVYQMCRDGRLPALRIGRFVRVDRAALEALLRNNTTTPKGHLND